MYVQIERYFTYVVIDAPPVKAVTDASVLAARASATLLVVEDHKTTHPALQHAQRTLDRVAGNMLGIVLNKIRRFWLRLQL